MKTLTSLSIFSILILLLASAAFAERSRTSARQSLPTKRINLEVHNADIRNVLRLFAEIGDINIVYGEDVEGTVTMRLKRVRWDHALRAILQTKGLDMQWQGNIIRVAKQETFAQERQHLLDAQQHCLDTAPLETRLIRVSHGNASTMVALIESTLTKRGSIVVDERTNTLIVRDVDCR